MSKTWVICGAGRAAGKTHLARALCRVLPGAACAKLGHEKRRPGGPRRYFRSSRALEAFVKSRSGKLDHVIVESNAWAREGKGDLMIFLDGPPGRLNVRPDVRLLRSRAHLRIGPGASRSSWEKVLARHVPDWKTRAAVIALLCDQAGFLRTPVFQVRSKVWIVSRHGRVFGAGVARLLGDIDRLGSLREAAKLSGISYRHAWGLLKTAARRLGYPIIDSRPGGEGGGGTVLAPESRRLVSTFDRLSREVEDFANRRFAGYVREMNPE